MEFLTGMLQQTLNVAEAFDVLERETGVAVADGPELAVADENSCPRSGYWIQPWMASTLGQAAIILCHSIPLDAAPHDRICGRRYHPCKLV